MLDLAQHPHLLALAAPLLAEAAAGYDTTQHFVRRFTWLSNAAQTWAHPRDVVLEVEHGERGPNPRFVVATVTGFDAGWIYDRAFCPRPERALHQGFKSARRRPAVVPSLRRQCVLAVSPRARVPLMSALRAEAGKVESSLRRVQLDTLRLRLLEVAALVCSVRRIVVPLPRVFPLAAAFTAIARHLGAT